MTLVYISLNIYIFLHDIYCVAAKENTVCRDSDGLTYVAGEVWTEDCWEFTCNYNGRLIKNRSTFCCEDEHYGTRKHGEAWEDECTVYTCDQGLIRKMLRKDHCCEDSDGKFHESGKKWTEDCTRWECNHGIAKCSLSPNCCEDNGNPWHNGDHWRHDCELFTCKRGKIKKKPDPDCCTIDKVKYKHEESWTDDCVIFTCKFGRLERELIAACCEDQGIIYHAGARWAHTCQLFKCSFGEIIEDPDPNCCEIGDDKFENGEEWTDGCLRNKCMAGKISSLLLPACCINETTIFYDGERWETHCYEHRCKYGTIHSSFVKSCCEVGNKFHENGYTWTSKCMDHKCKWGKVKSTPMKSCCEGDHGSLYEHGETWVSECWSNNCQRGETRTIVLKECCEVGEDVFKPDSGWDDECWNYKCVQGIIKRALKHNICCAIGDNVYRNGEFWYTGMVLYKCEHGIGKLINENDGGLDSQSPSVSNMGSNSLFEPIRFRRDVSDDTLAAHSHQKRAVIHKLSCWDHGEEIIHGAVWREECYRKHCYRGQLTMTVDPNCCEFDGAAYPNGATWSKDCMLYNCEKGNRNAELDSSCCSYEGEWYPHRHKLDSEKGCWRRECKFGKIKKTLKKSCCKGAYKDGAVWESSKVIKKCDNGDIVKYDSDKYCAYNKSVYKSGSTWKQDYNCHIYECDAGMIKTWIDYACLRDNEDDCAYDDFGHSFLPDEYNVYSCSWHGVIMRDGDMWTSDCTNYTCEHGEIVSNKIQGCCLDTVKACTWNFKSYSDEQEWSIACAHFKCIGGRLKVTGDDSCTRRTECKKMGSKCHNKQGVCRPWCLNGEVATGKCEGATCMCCEHAPFPTPNKEIPSELLCATQNMTCSNGQGTCRAFCKAREITMGNCDGLSCICCGIPVRSLTPQDTNKRTLLDAAYQIIENATNKNSPVACTNPSISCNDAQGLCKAICEPGEISIGKCDGLSCTCCGNALPNLTPQAVTEEIQSDAPYQIIKNDCLLTGMTLGNGKSLVDQTKCLTYTCTNGNLIEGYLQNCNTPVNPQNDCKIDGVTYQPGSTWRVGCTSNNCGTNGQIASSPIPGCQEPQEILKSPIAILGAAVNVITEPNTRSHGRISHSQPEGGAMDNKSSPAAMNMTGTKSRSPDQGNMSKKRVTSTKKAVILSHEVIVPVVQEDNIEKGVVLIPVHENNIEIAVAEKVTEEAAMIPNPLLPVPMVQEDNIENEVLLIPVYENNIENEAAVIPSLQVPVAMVQENDIEKGVVVIPVYENNIEIALIEEVTEDCVMDGKTHLNGDMWSIDCTIYSCITGQIQPRSDPTCCEFSSTWYTHGSTWSDGCYQYSCQAGSLQTSVINSCCTDDDAVYSAGQTWTKSCMDCSCNNGIIICTDSLYCCTVGGTGYKNEDTWVEKCVKHICINGSVISEDVENCCIVNGRPRRNNDRWLLEECYFGVCVQGNVIKQINPRCCEHNGAARQDGEVWSPQDCERCLCDSGVVNCGQDPKCLCHDEGHSYSDGSHWRYECFSNTCIKGTKHSRLLNECCLNGTVIYRNGDEWRDDCNICVCDYGLIGCDLDANCCRFEGKFYKNGATWKHVTYNYICEDGKIKKELDDGRNEIYY